MERGNRSAKPQGASSALCLVQCRKSTGGRRRAVTRTRSCGTSSVLTRTLVFMQVTREALEGSERADMTGFVF